VDLHNVGVNQHGEKVLSFTSIAFIERRKRAASTDGA
jgi:hypothetical protein